ncbi:SDR family oxidoreductase [Aneurinibacillus aneurinilyticus]|uniref:SDR family oxidoreductase n=1 Tax=Aneurinibacillus aneurinilyticus TaxID=1391 RepID=UPI0011DDDB47
MDWMLLEDKVAIVTGGGSGMGRAVSLLFAEQGAHVVVADIDEEAARQTSDHIGPRAFPIQGNVAEAEDVKRMVRETINRFGRIDILVNNAGVPLAFTPIEETEDETWDRMMDVNAKSIFLTAKHVVPHMKKSGGVIVNTASIAGIRARPGLHAYCASKGAAIMLTKALAIELAPHKIRVNAINPGPADTPMLSRFMNGDAEQIEKDTKEIFINSVPLGTLIEAQDIANAALYLCSDLAAKVTGEVLNVDGGRGI